MDKTLKTAIVLIATGEKYRAYAQRFLASAHEYLGFPYDMVMFTDAPEAFPYLTKPLKIPALGYPQATLLRYHMFHAASERLKHYDQVFYSDVDMLFVAPIAGTEIWSGGITATMHPGFVGLPGSTEQNPLSAAYLSRARTYFCGGFNGGDSKAFLKMSGVIRDAVDRDTRNGITAVWHDESHLNRYLYDNPPARILTPEFCFPESEMVAFPNGRYAKIWEAAGRTDIVRPRLVALDKAGR
jgi:hypothetical protein